MPSKVTFSKTKLQDFLMDCLVNTEPTIYMNYCSVGLLASTFD